MFTNYTSLNKPQSFHLFPPPHAQQLACDGIPVKLSAYFEHAHFGYKHTANNIILTREITLPKNYNLERATTIVNASEHLMNIRSLQFYLVRYQYTHRLKAQSFPKISILHT